MKQRIMKIIKNRKLQTIILGTVTLMLFLTIIIGSILVNNIERNHNNQWVIELKIGKYTLEYTI
ncbi:hypothetical protein V7146_11445 [Gottfriedia acidiceleris]|uniref:hypothetical protein n=1 Tax=Gottfriedia acidiceleris TaxID=371036 RepID=UPI002FFE3E7B